MPWICCLTILSPTVRKPEAFYGIDLSRTKLIRQAGFSDPVYLGIVANCPRIDSALDYLRYLYTGA